MAQKAEYDSLKTLNPNYGDCVVESLCKLLQIRSRGSMQTISDQPNNADCLAHEHRAPGPFYAQSVRQAQTPLTKGAGAFLFMGPGSPDCSMQLLCVATRSGTSRP